MFRAFFIAWLVMWSGFLGAVAFHPDDGFLLRSERLWQLFGIGAYLGAIALYAIAAIVLLRRALRGLRRLCHRGVTSLP